MSNRNTATRAQWEIFREPLGLPEIGLFIRIAFDGGVALECRRYCRVADGKPGDPRGGVEIPIKECGRDQKRIGIGVEAVRLLVRRKHGRNVDYNGQDVASRAALLGTIEAMQVRRSSRI